MEARMSVHSTMFGSVRLSGDDAQKFVRQVEKGRPKVEAVDSAKRGRSLAEEYAETGKATLSFAPKNSAR